MAKWKANACPKCGGNMFLDIDEQSWFNHCLQCGYMSNRSGVLCPECGDEMASTPAGYACEHCGCISEPTTGLEKS